MRHRFPFAGVLATIVLVSAHARIDPTFPPADDTRTPDLRLARIEGAGASVIAYTPDGRMLATTGGDPVVRLWDARTGEQGTGELVRTFTGHAERIVALGFTADGKFVTAFANDRSLRIWDVGTGTLIKGLMLQCAPRGAVFRPGLQPHLAEAGPGGVTLWNYELNERVKRFATDGSAVRIVAFSADGKRLVAAAADGTVRAWDVESGALLRTVPVGTGMQSIAASATHLAVGGTDGTARSWPIDGEGAVREFRLRAHTAEVRAVGFGPRGEQLASAGADGLVKVWDVASGTLLCTQVGHVAEVDAVVFNSNGQKMASGSADGAVNYWTVPLPPLPAADGEKIDAALPAKATTVPKKPRRVLVFWRADAILHKGGVPAANHAIELMGNKTGAYSADFSRDYESLEPKVLANYDAIVMNSTAHVVMPENARKALLNFARDGGGVIGIHAAIDMFKPWPDAAELIGATFGGHPWVPSGTWAVKLEEPGHPLLRAFGGKNFKIRDELYEMAAPYRREDRRVLLAVDVSDPATAKPGAEPLHRTDGDFAISWIKRFGKGRVFYAVFGHIAEPFENPAVLRFYLDGIQYALGDLEADDSPRSQSGL